MRELALKAPSKDLSDAMLEMFSMSNDIRNWEDVTEIFRRRLKGGEYRGRGELAYPLEDPEPAALGLSSLLALGELRVLTLTPQHQGLLPLVSKEGSLAFNENATGVLLGPSDLPPQGLLLVRDLTLGLVLGLLEEPDQHLVAELDQRSVLLKLVAHLADLGHLLDLAELGPT